MNVYRSNPGPVEAQAAASQAVIARRRDLLQAARTDIHGNPPHNPYYGYYNNPSRGGFGYAVASESLADPDGITVSDGPYVRTDGVVDGGPPIMAASLGGKIGAIAKSPYVWIGAAIVAGLLIRRARS